jgi:hypothetical protein
MWITKFHQTLAFASLWILSLAAALIGSYNGVTSDALFMTSLVFVLSALTALVMRTIPRCIWSQMLGPMTDAVMTHASQQAVHSHVTVDLAQAMVSSSTRVALDNQRDMETCMQCLCCNRLLMDASGACCCFARCGKWIVAPIAPQHEQHLQSSAANCCLSIGLRGCLLFGWLFVTVASTLNVILLLIVRVDKTHASQYVASDGYAMVSIMLVGHLVCLLHVLFIWNPQVEQLPVTIASNNVVLAPASSLSQSTSVWQDSRSASPSAFLERQADRVASATMASVTVVDAQPTPAEAPDMCVPLQASTSVGNLCDLHAPIMV